MKLGKKRLYRVAVGDVFRAHEVHEVVTNEIVPKAIEDAYRKGTNIIGKDLRKEVDVYEVNKLTEEFMNALKNHLDPEKYGDERGIYSSKHYVYLFFDIARLGNPNLEYMVLDLEEIEVGGEGLVNH